MTNREISGLRRQRAETRGPRPETRPGSETLPRLRPYQWDVARAIVLAVREGSGRTLSVMVSRQGGKNELSAQVELGFLLQLGSGDLLKIAPSLSPQGRISLNRLWNRLRQAKLAPPALREAGNAIRVGSNRLLLLSAAPHANVVGHTAGALMEVDEAQDVEMERFDRDFRPMGASRATCTVFYGTPWSETSLLEQMKARHLELEAKDGIRRHFEYGWETVSRSNPAYRRYAEAERERLGEQNPIWLTQYCLQTIPGQGRLFTPQQRVLLRGTHPRKRFRDREDGASLIVAGLDVAGEAFLPGRTHDETVLTVVRVSGLGSRVSDEWLKSESVARYPNPEPRDPPNDARHPTPIPAEPVLEILDHVVWRGAPHDLLLSEMTELLARVWQPSAIAVDATGMGEGLAAGLAARQRQHRATVLRIRITEPVKSALGYGLVAAAPRIRCYDADGSAEYHDFWRQVEHARVVYKPNRLMNFFVAPADGHDDYLSSLALATDAVRGAAPRIARGRTRE
ncbi:MAG: hypothetical protein ACR2PL_02090 [Dehalococcoidia bacterium]